MALAATVGTGSAWSRTFVYVSNAEDGAIACYALQADGGLEALGRVPVAKQVMPLAISPDRRFLYAAARSKPYSVHAFAIDAAQGALTPLGTAPLADSFPFISLDRTGRFLFGASYGGDLLSVNAVGGDGRVASAPSQVVAVGRNAHSVRIDETNRYVFVPALGTDQVFQFRFDTASGSVASNTPPAALLKAGSGPRHFVVAPGNRFVYLLNELVGSVVTFALDDATGLLKEVSSVSGLAPDSGLQPGAARLPAGAAGATPRNTDNDVWAADIHTTADGRFVYLSERTRSTLTALRAEPGTGALAYIGTWPTARQPRAFNIDPQGKYVVVSGEKSDTLFVHRIDAETGALRLVHEAPTGKGATWVEIVSFD